MSKRSFRNTCSVIVLAAFVMVMTMSGLPLVPTSHAQTADETDGSAMSRSREQLEAKFDLAESYDKADIEADPYAPDDREDSSTTTAAATSSGTLYQIQPIPLPGGLDHVANGTGTRNTGFGTIRLRGVLPGAVAVRAYLYWGVIQNAPPLTQTVNFNGWNVTGRLIGTGSSCWCGGVFAAYRASVIALLKPGIDGDYAVLNMPSAVKDGRDAWDAPCALPLSEGASLVVVYAHSSLPWNARVYLNDGTAFFAGLINIFNPIWPGVPGYSQLKHTRIGGDGQVGFSTASNLPITNERTFLGPGLTQIKGPGSPFNGDSDWNGDDGTPLNQLWDTHTDKFNKAIIPFGATNYLVQYSANGDCIYAVSHVLSVR